MFVPHESLVLQGVGGYANVEPTVSLIDSVKNVIGPTKEQPGGGRCLRLQQPVNLHIQQVGCNQ